MVSLSTEHVSIPAGASWKSCLWDLWCIGSVVGIWPRYIEPKLIATTWHRVSIAGLPPALRGQRIVQFSDIHLHPGMSQSFLEKFIRKIRDLEPDILVFTGDFLCQGKMTDGSRLKYVLDSLPSRCGSFAILGNHDYDQYLSINDEGVYDIAPPSDFGISAGLWRLWDSNEPTGEYTERVASVVPHPELVGLLADSSFTLLHNESTIVDTGGACVNLCGLGDYMGKKALPDEAFRCYDPAYPGIILSHNPDSLPMLRSFPGELILCGHTHGGAVNLPWIGRKVMLLENQQFRYGSFRIGSKFAYINRGLSGTIPFRWFSMPEISCFVLEQERSSCCGGC